MRAHPGNPRAPRTRPETEPSFHDRRAAEQHLDFHAARRDAGLLRRLAGARAKNHLRRLRVVVVIPAAALIAAARAGNLVQIGGVGPVDDLHVDLPGIERALAGRRQPELAREFGTFLHRLGNRVEKRSPSTGARADLRAHAARLLYERRVGRTRARWLHAPGVSAFNRGIGRGAPTVEGVEYVAVEESVPGRIENAGRQDQRVERVFTARKVLEVLRAEP